MPVVKKPQWGNGTIPVTYTRVADCEMCSKPLSGGDIFWYEKHSAQTKMRCDSCHQGVVATAAQIKIGEVVGARTGTYDGSDRWTVIKEQDVNDNRSGGVDYKSNSLTNNRVAAYVDPPNDEVKLDTPFGWQGGIFTNVGEYDGSDRWTYPGIGNVFVGVESKENSVVNNRTGILEALTLTTSQTIGKVGNLGVKGVVGGN